MKKTLNKVFVLGNGESRKTLNLNVLKTKGKVYGCNAIYRDSVVDALSVVDGGMMHEVYSSGYALNNKCYFRSFEKLPEFAYEPLISGLSDNFKDWGDAYHIENEKGNRTQFVLNGTDPQQMQRLRVFRISSIEEWCTIEKPLLQIPCRQLLHHNQLR